VAVIVEHQGDDASKRRAVQQRRTATHPIDGGSGQLSNPPHRRRLWPTDDGYEKLPGDGQIAARWRTSDLPGGGH